jgi:predicted nucleic acid-binding protein
VLWLAARQGVVSEAEALARLRFVRRLGIRSVPLSDLLPGAVPLAWARDLAVYDAVFALLAIRRGLPLVTFDQRLLDRVPERAARPGAPVTLRGLEKGAQPEGYRDELDRL